VVSRRAASCRRRASRSSGSFTVVRFMICQHTNGGETRDHADRRHSSDADTRYCH
jgi:hypothetical protein